MGCELESVEDLSICQSRRVKVTSSFWYLLSIKTRIRTKIVFFFAIIVLHKQKAAGKHLDKGSPANHPWEILVWLTKYITKSSYHLSPFFHHQDTEGMNQIEYSFRWFSSGTNSSVVFLIQKVRFVVLDGCECQEPRSVFFNANLNIFVL